MRDFIRALLFSLLAAGIASAAQPDPDAVERWQAGWKYPQAGWIVLHIEGEPYQRGLQHGHLMAHEIAAYQRALAGFWGPAAPQLAWSDARRLTGALFLHGFDREQLEEMRGIADGASAEGDKLDLVDIATINSANEIDALDDALAVTPTGLEGVDFAAPASPLHPARRRPRRCSAFAAIGPATKDGKLVFGHVTMYDLYPANYYNVWLEIRPAKGHRIVMQTTPGGMHSGMDYSINDAGILLAETTVKQTAYVAGVPLAARIRQAEQYADSIDSAVEILSRNGNGLSTAEWLLADLHANEIALLTLGSKKAELHRSSKSQWIGGAEGFYWSDNNIKDLSIRLETVADLDGRPSATAAFQPIRRDAIWLDLYDQGKGRIDADYAKLMLTNAEIDSPFAVDAKYTTADLASLLESFAAFGPPVDPVWEPTALERKNFPEIQPLVQNPWTLLDVTPPAAAGNASADRNWAAPVKRVRIDDSEEAAWHGTLLPKSDSDIWLTTGFANYERWVALERKLRRQNDDGELDGGDLDDLGVELAGYRALYEQGARAGSDTPLSRTRSSYRDSNSYAVASGKGVLFLHSLRGVIGAKAFDAAMEEFGHAHAGQPVAAAEFEAFLLKRADVKPMFDWWLNGAGLPRLAIRNARTDRQGGGWVTKVTLDTARLGPALRIPVTVTTGREETTVEQLFDADHPSIEIKTEERPDRVILDKYGLAARANGSPFTILTFDNELDDTLVVAGTLDEAAANLEAARKLQHSLHRREYGPLPKLVTDDAVTDADLASHHLLLVGRPATNKLAARFADLLPVRFGANSFQVRGELYNQPDSAVVAAAENPLNHRFSLVAIAGLSALATYQMTPLFEDDLLSYAGVVVLGHAQEREAFVAPTPELEADLR
jgi:hypothetical protein